MIDAWQGVPVSIDYEWRDGGDNSTMREQNFGSVRADYRAGNTSYPFEPKPAFLAMRTHHSLVAGASFTSRIDAGGSGTTPGGIYAMRFGRRSGGDVVAAWTTGSLDNCPSMPTRRNCGFYGISQDRESCGCGCLAPRGRPAPHPQLALLVDVRRVRGQGLLLRPQQVGSVVFCPRRRR